MHQALYRKWRPQRFEDVVGQEPVVAALRNQVKSNRIGHAYLFTGTRGTGKTTCARIFAKALNCLNPQDGNPCCQCELCRALDNETLMDVLEIDAASNNGVDDIRSLREEVGYLPSQGKYKIYILDEVHMMSANAWNAFLKILEEPPEHVIFILATTEVNKVLPTVLSRCQRYDFTRINPDKIAARLEYIAGEEKLELTHGAAQLIARLADGALRDGLSILDTCAGTTTHVDEDVVRRMAGVTDKSYLFRISDLLTEKNAPDALEEVAQLRQKSVDMKRLCNELINHYRNLMLAPLPGGKELLNGVAMEDEELYAQKGKEIGQATAIQTIRILGEALEKMGRGIDPRISLELAIFQLINPTPVAVAPSAVAPVAFAAARPAAAPAPQNMAPYVPSEKPTAALAAKAQAAAATPKPIPTKAPELVRTAPPPIEKEVPQELHEPEPFPQWSAVLERLEGQDGLLTSYLKGRKAYFNGKQVLFECDSFARDYIRNSKDSRELLKKLILEVTGIRCGIGPYEGKTSEESNQGPTAEDTLQKMREKGIPVIVEEKA